jgi:uncharacterized membrane protein
MGIWKNAVLFYLGGMGYVALELIWRGWSHGSMFLVGGLCFLLLGNIDRFVPDMPLLFQSVLGAILVTGVELVSGLIINLWLGLGVWDYSGYPYEFLGQVCMSYFFLWIWVAAFAVLLEDLLRTKLFGETALSYRLI